ncbi:MAG: hypothetical protein ACFCBU_10245 [Cyanophyceae cyanobacterium]
MRRLIQTGKTRIAITNFGDVQGFLVPLSDVPTDIPSQIQTLAYPDFVRRFHRDRLWEFPEGVEAIALTFHTRHVVWYVHPDLQYLLPLDLAPCSRDLLERTYQSS